nr:MAG TPA: conjugal transfer protein [Caudoviricetes sp.]
MKVYKGTDKDMRCKGLQYEIGKAVTVDGDVKLCERGLHACEMPLDVLNYYPPAESRYFEAELEGVTAEKRDDTKRVGNRLEMKAELSIAGLVKAQIEYVKERVTPENTEHATGDRGAASATGDQGAASATGYRGAASATGDRGAASATGYQGAASATGIRGAASATGYQGAASATGDQGAASATGYQGAASATGYQGAASATGNRGAASATGAACVALSTGLDGKVMGLLGNAIVCVERGDWDGSTYPIKSIMSAVVDGETIKANVWYTVKKGKWVEVE